MPTSATKTKEKQLALIDTMVGEIQAKGGKSPSLRTIIALKTMVAKGCTMADALREANYSDAVVRNPSKVFDTEFVRDVLEKAKITEESVAPILERKLNARKLETRSFPPYVEGAGEGVSDDQIRTMMVDVGYKVYHIVKGKNERVVHFSRENDYLQLQALDMTFNLLGAYAPKKQDIKQQTHHTFSLSAIRKGAEKPKHVNAVAVETPTKKKKK